MGAGGVSVVVAAADHKVEPSAVFLSAQAGGRHQMAQKKINAVRWRPSRCFLPLIYRHTRVVRVWEMRAGDGQRNSTTTGCASASLVLRTLPQSAKGYAWRRSGLGAVIGTGAR